MKKWCTRKKGLTLIGTIAGKALIGKICQAPVIHRNIPVLPASFCRPEVGTGLVTSVPSDAPDDWISLKTLQEDDSLMEKYGLDKDMIRSIRPIAIIDTKGYGPMPAVEMINKWGITDPCDPRLEDAKKLIYKDGFHTGKMNGDCGDFAGMKVEEAKDQIKNMMIKNGEAELFYDLSEEVICRCGKCVVIKKVPDQWFIDYGNTELTGKSKEHAKEMEILPNEYYVNIQGVLDWFRERACVRQGNWLGTKFPYDEKWTIEAISDSTLYPIYYLISKYYNSGQLKLEQMTEQFFDHVMLGKGDAAKVAKTVGMDLDLLLQIRDDVVYWYPLDVNLGGKEHMTVHFPAFLKNHVAILPKELWPKGIFVNWYVTGKLGKISKSKGGAEPIPGAAGRFGVDALRLYYAHIAVPFVDVEWDDSIIENYTSRIEKVLRSVDDLHALSGSSESTVDRWLLSRMNNRITIIQKAMEQYDLRKMANEVYFETFNDIKWYIRRGGDNRATVTKFLNMWIRMMTPITPHIAEELWEKEGHNEFVSSSEYPSLDNESQDARSEASEDYLSSVMTDTNEILKVTGISPKRIFIYTTAQWKREVLSMGLQMVSSENIVNTCAYQGCDDE